jgi:hypothetical protein
MMGTTFTVLVRKPAEWTTWEIQALIQTWNQYVSYRQWGCRQYSPASG